MKYIVIVIMMMISSTDCNAQNGLEYFFSNEVTKSLEEYIDSSLHEEKEANDFYLVLYHKTDNAFKLNVSLKGEVDKEKTEMMLNLTNRYVMIDQHKLPIILEEDFKFGVFGRDNVGIKRWFLISEGFSITIDGRGRIVD